MKEGWTYKKLGEVASFARGLTYSKNDEVEHSNNIVLRSNNIDLIAGKLDFSELKYLKEDFVIPDDKRLRKGSLFICMSNGSKAHLGKVAYVDKDYSYAFGGFMGQISPNNEINGLYLHYALSSPFYKEYIKSLSEGANINNLKFKDLSEFPIKYPPLSEQQSIVDYLDSAFAKIDAMKANAEKALNEAKALFQASLKEMLEPKEGWEEKKLGEICTFSQGVQVPLQNQSLKESAGYTRFLRIIDFTQGSEPPRYVPINDAKYWMNHEDIAIVRYGASTGFICTGLEGTLANNLFRLNIKCDVSPHYLIYVLKSEIFQSVIKVQMNGAAMPAISFGLIEGIKMPIPSHSEQQSIVTTLDSLKSKVDRLQENYNKISQECDALKQAILRQVFE